MKLMEPSVSEHHMMWPVPPRERCGLLSIRMGAQEFTLELEARSHALVALYSRASLAWMSLTSGLPNKVQ